MSTWSTGEAAHLAVKSMGTRGANANCPCFTQGGEGSGGTFGAYIFTSET